MEFSWLPPPIIDAVALMLWFTRIYSLSEHEGLADSADTTVDAEIESLLE